MVDQEEEHHKSSKDPPRKRQHLPEEVARKDSAVHNWIIPPEEEAAVLEKCPNHKVAAEASAAEASVAGEGTQPEDRSAVPLAVMSEPPAAERTESPMQTGQMGWPLFQTSVTTSKDFVSTDADLRQSEFVPSSIVL